MRKSFAIAALLVFSGLPVLAQSRFSLKGTGAWGYISAGDLNKANRSNNEKADAFFGDSTSPYPAVHSAALVGLEACFALSKRLSIGLGGAYYPGSFDTGFFYRQGPIYVGRQYNIDLKIVPVTLNGYLSIPVRRWLDMVAAVGIGYYPTTFELVDHAEFDAGPAGRSIVRYEFRSRTGAFGVQGGLGFEVKITPGWRFLVQGIGRAAELKEVRGDWTSLTTSPAGSISEGGSDHVLFFVDEEIEGKTYSRLHFDRTAPSGLKLSRKGTIDLSGFAIVGGFRFTFGKKDPADGSLIFRI
jgi:hypothetical protein